MTDGGEGSGGYKYTEEQRKVKREQNARKGNPFYGKTHTEESKKAMSEKHKLRLSNKENHPNYGRKFPWLSERNKIIKYCGEKNGWYGKGYLEKGENNPRFGVKLSDEEKKNISEKVKKAWANPEIRDKYMKPKSDLHRKHLSEARIGLNKGKTYEEIYGEEKARELKQHQSLIARQHGLGSIIRGKRGKGKSFEIAA